MTGTICHVEHHKQAELTLNNIGGKCLWAVRKPPVLASAVLGTRDAITHKLSSNALKKAILSPH
jgi:hypothetical protein